jgi:hypothetical protein
MILYAIAAGGFLLFGQILPLCKASNVYRRTLFRGQVRCSSCLRMLRVLIVFIDV